MIIYSKNATESEVLIRQHLTNNAEDIRSIELFAIASDNPFTNNSTLALFVKNQSSSDNLFLTNIAARDDFQLNRLNRTLDDISKFSQQYFFNNGYLPVEIYNCDLARAKDLLIKHTFDYEIITRDKFLNLF